MCFVNIQREPSTPTLKSLLWLAIRGRARLALRSWRGVGRAVFDLVFRYYLEDRPTSGRLPYPRGSRTLPRGTKYFPTGGIISVEQFSVQSGVGITQHSWKNIPIEATFLTFTLYLLNPHRIASRIWLFIRALAIKRKRS